MESYQSNKELRLVYKKLRDEMSTDLRNLKSEGIVDNVLALLESDFKGANIFLCFYPFASEVDLIPLYKKLLENGKDLYFPVSDIKNHKLNFIHIKDLVKDFHIGSFGIMEPNDDLKKFDYQEALNNKTQIVSITPGLIFDKKFNRIGYGAGFYDRFLSDKQMIITIAPIFSEQLVEHLDVYEHDVPMKYIVTETEVLKGERL